jgi:diguanylate cyclase (GGDEF)-like protein/PAS domain S-box-containing protein
MNPSHLVQTGSDSDVVPPRDVEVVPAHEPSVRAGQVQVAAPKPRTAGSLQQAPRSAGSGSARAATSDNHLTTREWVFMAPAMALSVPASAILAWSIPPVLAQLLALSAIVIACAANKVAAYEQTPGRTLIRRYLAMIAGVAFPMQLFGFAIAIWAKTGGLPWPDGLAVLVTTGAVISTILSKRMPAMIAGQIALWTGVCLLLASLITILALLSGIGIAIFAGFRQARLDRAADNLRQEARRAQLRAEELLAEYEETGQGWFWETDRRGVISYLSPTISQLLRRSPDELRGRPFTELFILDHSNREGERTLNFHLSARSSFQDLAVRAATPGDDERWWSVTGRPVHDSFNNFVGFRGSGSDLTEKKRSQEDASRLAHYDSLTNLANRFQMAQTLEKILSSQRIEQRACTVFLLDLDRFKQVNDTMGHPAGDALLTQVAQRLERSVDKLGRVGRLGGDEFQVIIPGTFRRPELAQLANRIIENLSHAYSIDGMRAVIGVSIGIAMSPEDGVTSEALIRNADLALYAAKDGGRGRHHFYASDLHSDAEERRELEQDLRDALASGGLALHYQPVVHTTTEKITGFEALLRWTHPVHGPLSPSKFIPIAEETGLITQIGEWALRSACHDLAKWPESVRVAVNVSPLQFANPALPAIVTSALAAAQINPERLELEITESVFLNDDAGTDAMFAALKRIGVRLSLDDFGTGYSSLGYLKKAPFDKIKIDQSFVRGATKPGSRNGAIIASIVSLAEALGMETTAEGVETLDELDLIRMLGCSHIQGFIYDRPLTVDSASDRLKTGLVAIAQGPRAARSHRHTMLRKVILESDGEHYQGTIRNISDTGAMIEGLWNVPKDTTFKVQMRPDQIVTATARWSQDDRMGVEFAEKLQRDLSGQATLTPQPALRKPSEAILLKKAR